jgi:hypothetical protein
MTTINKTTREVETREFSTRPKQWAPASLLPEPDKQAGYSYRWVRVSYPSKQEYDPLNIQNSLSEGWEPVKTEEQPQYKHLVDSDTKYKGFIEVRGLLLCKVPTEFVHQRNAYYSGIARQQVESSDKDLLSMNDPRMRTYKESRSTVSFGRG